MQSLDIIVLQQALEWLKRGETIWLSTVLHTYGSAPRSPGALFVAIKDGQYKGSLSGGCIEEDFLKRIADGEYTEPSSLTLYGEGGHPSKNKLPCGGTISLLVECMTPSESNINYIDEMLQALEGKIQRVKHIEIPQPAQLQEAAPDCAFPRVTQENNQITIKLDSTATLLIACFSSVAHYCIDYANALGFEVIVCEHRQEELRQLKAMLNLAEKVKVLEVFPATYIEEQGCHSNTAIISLTHDPRIDDLTMMAACETPAFYIGAMGSKRNSLNRFERLRTAAELSDEQLARIHAPIGLPIGSKSPAEIALAIMADIVKTKNAAP